MPLSVIMKKVMRKGIIISLIHIIPIVQERKENHKKNLDIMHVN